MGVTYDEKMVGNQAEMMMNTAHKETIEQPLMEVQAKINQPLIYFLKDPANMVTLLGCFISALSLAFVCQERYYLALSLLMMGTMLDYLDGYIAKNTPGRDPILREFGGHFDSLADVVNGGIVPGLFLMKTSNMATIPVLVASVYICAVCTRLAYFDLIGMMNNGNYYLGLPKDYGVITTCIVGHFMPFLERDTFNLILTLSLGIMSFCLLTPRLRARYTKGVDLIIVLIFFTTMCLTSLALEFFPANSSTTGSFLFQIVLCLICFVMSYPSFYKYIEINN